MQCVDLGGRRIIKKKFFQAEDGIRDFCLSRGLGDVYKRQHHMTRGLYHAGADHVGIDQEETGSRAVDGAVSYTHLTLPTICSV